MGLARPTDVLQRLCYLIFAICYLLFRSFSLLAPREVLLPYPLASTVAGRIQ